MCPLSQPLHKLSSQTERCKVDPPVALNRCADVADCFHRMRLSGEIRHFFCWPGVSNKYLRMTEIDGTKISPHQTLWPRCCSLPMGFSWSLHFPQSANRARLNRQPSLRHGVEMTDRGPPLVLSKQGHNAHTSHCLYVGQHWPCQ